MLHPIVTPELIAHLRGVFPAALTRSHSDRDAHFVVGQQEVINYLQQLLEQEQNGTFDPEDS